MPLQTSASLSDVLLADVTFLPQYSRAVTQQLRPRRMFVRFFRTRSSELGAKCCWKSYSNGLLAWLRSSSPFPRLSLSSFITPLLSLSILTISFILHFLALTGTVVWSGDSLSKIVVVLAAIRAARARIIDLTWWFGDSEPRTTNPKINDKIKPMRLTQNNELIKWNYRICAQLQVVQWHAQNTTISWWHHQQELPIQNLASCFLFICIR